MQQLACLAEDNDFHQALQDHLEPIQQQTKRIANKANVITRKKETHAELVNYLHAACYSPVKSTFVTAIKKFFVKTWPGLSTKLADKYLTESIATSKGHMAQERQHSQTTKSINKHPISDLCQNMDKLNLNHVYKHDVNISAENPLPLPHTRNTKSRMVAYAIIDHDKHSVGYIDATGRFPQRSSRGHEYILIGYHYDGNTILATPLKDRSATSLTNAWKTMHTTFNESTEAPNIYVLDNEKSNELINAFTIHNVSYQLVPPHNHRTNLAERAIQTFKAHFKAGLATCDPNFPLTEWDRLISQAVLTLNLLRPSRVKPNISAHTFLFGEFDFNSTPLAPPPPPVQK